MDGNRSRKRRIVRVVLLTVVAPLLLLTGYVSTWLAVSRVARENFISRNTALTLRPAFVPLIWFGGTHYPGAAELRALWWRVNPPKVVHQGNVRIQYATPALAFAPVDVAQVSAQPVALPQPVARGASAMRR